MLKTMRRAGDTAQRRDPTITSPATGGGAGYLGTIEGVHVYSARITHKAVLFSSRLIRAIEYGVVHGTNDVVDFSFVDGEDLTKSRVRMKFAQHIEWADDGVVEFQMTGPVSNDA
jgi:hypothetical protein